MLTYQESPSSPFIGSEKIMHERIIQVLKTHSFNVKHLRPLVISSGSRPALALEVEAIDALAVWRALFEHRQTTQHYPLIVHDWGSEDFFSRFYYQEEVSQGLLLNSAPDAIIPQAQQTAIANFLEQEKSADQDYLEDCLPMALEETVVRYGTAPAKAEIDSLIADHHIQSPYDLEQWLWQWELAHFELSRVLAPEFTGYLDWFDPQTPDATILLLPTLHSWQTLAYVHWYGSCRCGTATAMAFLRHWHQRYGTELVCHYGTMLQLESLRLPLNPSAAFQLAWEQVALAPCTTILPGVSLRDHARSLMATPRWFLHERP